MGNHPPLSSFPQTTRGGVILSERAECARAKDLLADAGGRRGCAARARAKDVLWCGAHEKQVLRACGAQDDTLARFGRERWEATLPFSLSLKPRAAVSS